MNVLALPSRVPNYRSPLFTVKIKLISKCCFFQYVKVFFARIKRATARAWV